MALVLHNFGGAEAGVVAGVQAANEVNVTAGTTHNSTVQRSGSYCYSLSPGSSALNRFPFVEVGNTALQGNDLIAVAALRFADVTPGTAYQFLQLTPVGSATRSVGVQLNTDGTVSILDAGGSVVATSAGTPFSVDTWHVCKLYVTEHDSAGAVELFVDSASVVSIGSIDTVSADGAIADLVFLGAGTGDGFVFVDDWAVWSGATDPSDVPENIRVLGYWHETGSTEYGTALDAGTWSLTADNNEGSVASYNDGGTATQSGGFDCDAGTFGGPSGDARIGAGDVIEGCKWFLSGNKSLGTPTHFLLCGNNVDGTASFGITFASSSSERKAKVSDASDGFVPTVTQFARIGGESQSASDLDMRSMRVFVLYSVGPPSVEISVADNMDNWGEAAFNDAPDGSWIIPSVHKTIEAADDIENWGESAETSLYTQQSIEVADDLDNWADAVADPSAAVNLSINVSDSLNSWGDAVGSARGERFSSNVIPIMELALPSGTHYLAHDTVRHPTRVYSGDVISFGSVERSIPTPAGFPRLSDVTVKIADTAKTWRKLLAQQSAKAGTITIRLANVDGSESLAYTVFRGEIIAAKFPPGAVEITASDRIYSKMAEEIPSLVTLANFGALPDDTNEVFAPIGYGNNSTELTTRLGSHACPLVDVPQGRYLVARTPIKSIDAVYVWEPGDDEFEVVAPRQSGWSGTASARRLSFSSNAGWSKVEDTHVIDGITHTFTYLEFASALPDGSIVRVDFQGIMDADGNLIENPLRILQDMLSRFLKLDADSDMVNLTAFDAAADVATALGYVGAHVINQSMTWQQMIARLVASFNIDFFTDRSGRLSCKLITSDPVDMPIFDDLEILDDSFADSLPIDVYNRLTYRYQLISANNDWFTSEIYDNEADQEQLEGKILETDLDLHWVHSAEIAAQVVADIGGYWDLASVGVEFNLSAPRVIELFDLADIVGITHFEGVEEETGEWFEKPFKVTMLRLDLDQLVYHVRGISRQGLPVVGGGPTPTAEMVDCLVPGPFQYGRQAYMTGIFVPKGDFTRLRAIYTLDWGQTWTAVDTAVFATEISSAQAYQRGRYIHVVTQEVATGRVAYHRFDQLSRNWEIENEQVVATTEIDSGVRSAEPIWHLSTIPMFTNPACDIVARSNGEVVISYTGGVRAEDDGTANGSDPAGPAFYWFCAQFCRVRSAGGVWGSAVRIGHNWPDSTGVYTPSEGRARAILGPDGMRVYFLYGTLGHETPFSGNYFYGYKHYAISSLGPSGGMTHHCRFYNANIHGSYSSLAGILGRVESDSTHLFGGWKGNNIFHRGVGFAWSIADLAIYHTLDLASLHEDLVPLITPENCQDSHSDANRASMHVVLVDGSPVWFYLPWWSPLSSASSAPKVLDESNWITVGSSGNYTDIMPFAFDHAGKTYYGLFMNRVNTLDHFELWSEDDLPIALTLAEWQTLYG